MTLIDGIVVFMIVLGAWRGFGQGLVKTTLRLLAWLTSVLLAFGLYEAVMPWVVFVQAGVMQVITAFLLVFGVVMAIWQVILYILQKLLKLLQLGLLDRVLGAMLGAGLGLTKMLLFLSLSQPVLSHFAMWQQSVLVPIILPISPIAKQWIATSF